MSVLAGSLEISSGSRDFDDGTHEDERFEEAGASTTGRRLQAW